MILFFLGAYTKNRMKTKKMLPLFPTQIDGQAFLFLPYAYLRFYERVNFGMEEGDGVHTSSYKIFQLFTLLSNSVSMADSIFRLQKSTVFVRIALCSLSWLCKFQTLAVGRANYLVLNKFAG